MADVRLIDANALGRYISDWQMSLPGDNRPNWNDAVYDTLDDVFDVINEAPTIDPESLRPVAQWEEDDYAFNRCSRCGWEWDESEYKTTYCPNCGAKMEDDDA